MFYSARRFWLSKSSRKSKTKASWQDAKGFGLQHFCVEEALFWQPMVHRFIDQIVCGSHGFWAPVHSLPCFRRTSSDTNHPIDVLLREKGNNSERYLVVVSSLSLDWKDLLATFVIYVCSLVWDCALALCRAPALKVIWNWVGKGMTPLYRWDTWCFHFRTFTCAFLAGIGEDSRSEQLRAPTSLALVLLEV